ncbi:hypothetical protein CMV_026498 [Castanea mollissima]|uniref:Plant heme peroxidase family profile domain-containing protein n=1 Tax=Castanea mollissima TaxID=60419 RepID=A0A8J4QBS1_9ROSI|nr:hypothetical protein CMV_026498 [Castanea mollissima]
MELCKSQTNPLLCSVSETLFLLKGQLRCLVAASNNQGCDASVPLDDSNGYKNHSIPNHTLRGVDKIDFIKKELEKAWPGGTFMC